MSAVLENLTIASRINGALTVTLTKELELSTSPIVEWWISTEIYEYHPETTINGFVHYTDEQGPIQRYFERPISWFSSLFN